MNLLQELLAVEEQRRDAWLRRDRNALGELLDENFLEINYFGRLTKKQLLEDLFNRLILIQFSIENGRVLGNSPSPILTYACREELTVDGNPVSGNFHVASHYALRSSGWKILLWQITPCPESE